MVLDEIKAQDGQGSNKAAARVSASLWSVSEHERMSTALELSQAGLRLWHWDFSDGSLGKAGGFTADEAYKINTQTRLPGEAHLMTTTPLEILRDWIPVCDRIIIHAEAENVDKCIETLQRNGRTAVIAIKPETPLSVLDTFPKNVGVLVMSVSPGEAGSTFNEQTYSRLSALGGRETLGVDGSVNRSRAHRCFHHGATWVVSGTDLCNSSSKQAWLAEMEDSSVT